jgi:hypothetical protein
MVVCRYIPALSASDVRRVESDLLFRRLSIRSGSGSGSSETRMAESREDLVRQIRQCKLDRVSTDDPKLREKLRTLILRLEIMLAQMEAC